MDPIALVDDRQRWLLDRLAGHRRLITAEVADELGVSVDTVRRDLRALHHQGRLRRVHGGAVPVSPLSASYRGRADESEAARRVLAKAVADRFRAGQVIGLDAGSTNADVARTIPDSLPVTIVTNSPAAAMALADHPSAEVVLLGGVVDLTWMATTGAAVVDTWRSHHLDVAVLGACGFDAEAGLTTRSVNEVETKRALIDAAAEVVLPVQQEKLGTRAPFLVCGAEAIDVVVIDDETDDDTTEGFRSIGLDVLIAGS